MSQYEENPRIVYDQNNWVSAANYQNYRPDNLIDLWVLLNKHICIILKNLPAGGEERFCDAGQLHSIKWLAEDYNKHLLHHLHHLLKLQLITYP